MGMIGNVSDKYDAYMNIRFKSYDQGVMWLEDNPELIAVGFGYEKEQVQQIIQDLEGQVTEMARDI